jgi:predicted PurR-regulated permease PerM
MIILAAVVAIVASLNIVQFQLSKSIQDSIAELQNENSQLRERLITAKSTDNSSSYSAEHNNGIRQASLSFSDTNNFSLSTVREVLDHFTL